MKWISKYRIHLLVFLNIMFWTVWIVKDTIEYWDNAIFYARWEIVEEQGVKKEYMFCENGTMKDISTVEVPPERFAKYSLVYCFWQTFIKFIPFLLVIYGNWFFLIPKWLTKQHYSAYFGGLFLLVLLSSILLAVFSDTFYTGTIFVINNYRFHIPEIVETFQLCSLISLFITPSYLSYNWFIQQEKITRLQNEQLTTELALLKSQINPHFFFNTLNNLYALTLENSSQAPNAILKLSDLMRYTIYEGKEEQVAIQQEVDCLENYLHLQAIRASKPVDVRFERHIADEKLQVPPLLFLSFLENAFKHGVDTQRAGAYVHIELKTTKQQLYFQIENNYNPQERIAGSGAGLENTKRRLVLLYPDRHELQIQDENAIFKVSLNINLY